MSTEQSTRALPDTNRERGEGAAGSARGRTRPPSQGPAEPGTAPSHKGGSPGAGRRRGGHGTAGGVGEMPLASPVRDGPRKGSGGGGKGLTAQLNAGSRRPPGSAERDAS